MKRIVLASTSTWRRQLLEEAGLSCEAMSPDIEEESIVGTGAVDTAKMRATAKANAVAEHCPDAIVLGADQVIHMDGQTIGKPEDDADWRRRLISMRGRTHQLTTAVALVEDSQVEVFSVTTQVTMRSDLTDAEIDAYIQLGEARGCAGGYMIERRGAWLVESIDGDWLNVVGLPVLHVVSRLRARGWRVTL
jgi:septum formation protein